MITHSITLYGNVFPLSKEEIKKERIFERTLNNLDPNTFYLGGCYQVKNKKEEGSLIYICQKSSEVEWDGLKVKMLELWFPDTQDTKLFHPSDLKEIKDV